MKQGKTILLVFCLAGLFLLAFGCAKHNPGAPFGQVPPETFLANVPADFAGADTGSVWHDNHRTFPVCWSGTDRDGFVVAYFWAIDDTTAWTRVDATVTQDTIVFAAPVPNDTAYHVFYVRAMDNDSLLDPTPAHRIFRTRNQLPSARITKFEAQTPNIQRGQSFFCLSATTATWDGISVEFGCSDPDSIFAPEFSWKWDNGAWSPWSTETKVGFTGSTDPALRIPEPGLHTLYVRARDDAMAVDSVPYANPDTAEITDSLTVLIVSPTLDQGILFVDADNFNSRQLRGSEASSDLFYDNMMASAGYGNFARWERSDPARGFPPDSVLGRYSVVIYCADLRGDSYSDSLNSDWEKLGNYLSVGGRTWITGWSPLRRYSTVMGYNTGYPYEAYEFPARYLGLQSARVHYTPSYYDFMGATPVLSGYPALQADSAKIVGTTTGGLSVVTLVRVDTTFTPRADTLYAYNSYYQDTTFNYADHACVFRYTGPTFKTVYNGFPLFAMKPEADVALYAKQVLDWLSQ